MQEPVHNLPVRAVGQSLLDQAAQPAQVAFEPAQFQIRFLMFKAWNGCSQANPFAEGRK